MEILAETLGEWWRGWLLALVEIGCKLWGMSERKAKPEVVGSLNAMAFLFENVKTDEMAERVERMVQAAHKSVRETFPARTPIDAQLALVQIELLALVALELHAHRRHNAHRNPVRPAKKS